MLSLHYAHEALRYANERGVTVTLDGSRLLLTAKSRIPRGVIALVRQHEPSIMAKLIAERAGGNPEETRQAFLADPRLSATLAVLWRTFCRDAFDPYRPERHYMRGPGPKWRARHGIAEPGTQGPTFAPTHATPAAA